MLKTAHRWEHGSCEAGKTAAIPQPSHRTGAPASCRDVDSAAHVSAQHRKGCQVPPLGRIIGSHPGSAAALTCPEQPRPRPSASCDSCLQSRVPQCLASVPRPAAPASSNPRPEPAALVAAAAARDCASSGGSTHQYVVRLHHEWEDGEERCKAESLCVSQFSPSHHRNTPSKSPRYNLTFLLVR